jgi:hypothetical protein
MPLPRPSTRFGWWLTFAASVTALPAALFYLFSVAPPSIGLGIFLLTLLSVPVALTYLVCVTRLNLFVKLPLIVALVGTSVFVLSPKPLCGGRHDRMREGALMAEVKAEVKSRGCRG